ncbi:MAG TPA: glycosyltransferase family A protein [Tepidisphaeraceae bacterium]
MTLISIVIPMRNCQRTIKPALVSILAQKDVDLEIIVVDDGSTDQSATCVREVTDPRVRMVPGPCRGIAAALNRGLQEVKGDYFCRCDADDLFSPNRFAWQKQWLQEHPEFGAICGAYVTVDEDLKPVADHVWKPQPAEVTQDLRSGRGSTHLGTFMVRMELVKQLGSFRDYFIGTEDVDFVLRLGEITRVWYDPRPVYIYRLHAASITHTQAQAQRRFLEKMAHEFQRQRLTRGSDDLQLGTAPPPPTDLDPAGTQVNARIQDLLIGAAWREHREGRRFLALKTGFRAALMKPTSGRIWKSVLALVVKPAGQAPSES